MLAKQREGGGQSRGGREREGDRESRGVSERGRGRGTERVGV